MAPFCVFSSLAGPRDFPSESGNFPKGMLKEVPSESGNFPKGMLKEVPWLTPNEKEVVAVPMLQNLVMYGDLDGSLNRMGWKKLYAEKNLGSWLKNQVEKVEKKGVVSYDWLAARCVPTHPEFTKDIVTLKKWTNAVRYEVVLALRYLRGEAFPLPATRNLLYCDETEYNNLQDGVLTDAVGQLPKFL